MKKLGIISGSGDLPFLLAKSVADHGMEPIVIQVTQEMSPELGKIVNHIHPIGIGQIRKIIKLFLDSGVDEAAIIGKIEKSILLNPLPTKFPLASRLTAAGDSAEVATLKERPTTEFAGALERLAKAALSLLV